MNNMTTIPDKDIRVRAYHIYLQGHGKSDKERYFMAKKLATKIRDEKSTEIDTTSDDQLHTCILCHTRYGTIIPDYLPKDMPVCWWCYLLIQKHN